MDKNSITEEESKAINGNSLLLSLEGFIKFVEGLNRGIQSASSINPQIVLESIGEVLEYLVTTKTHLRILLTAFDGILEQKEQLQKRVDELEQQVIELEAENTQMDITIAKLEAELGGE